MAKFLFKCPLACPNGFASDEMPLAAPKCSVHNVVMVLQPSPLEDRIADLERRVAQLEGARRESRQPQLGQNK